MAILEIFINKNPSKGHPPYALVFGTLDGKHKTMYCVTKTSGCFSHFEERDITHDFFSHYKLKIVVSKNLRDISKAQDVVANVAIGKNDKRCCDLKEWYVEVLKNLKDEGVISEEEHEKSYSVLKRFEIYDPTEYDSIIYPLIATGTVFGGVGLLYGLCYLIFL